ncbi:MAG: hypothetical protein JEZ14_11735 [Marinilabiliaceae bacterium]|nr:hypothetical protein [Marinilabiliaceae bacterium]
MKKKTNSFYFPTYLTFFIVIALLSSSCKKHTRNETSGLQFDLAEMELLADSITYTVVVKNRDTLDTWADQRLSGLNHKKLVNDLFDAVYEHEATPYDYYTHQPLTISDIKRLEKKDDFTRDRVGQLQFCEAWYMNAETHQMHKQIHSVLIAYEYLNSNGELRGYKAAFYIKMDTNQDSPSE